jgi:hypothetical protein
MLHQESQSHDVLQGDGGVRDVEETTLTCIGDQGFMILGNDSIGNRKTPKHDFPMAKRVGLREVSAEDRWHTISGFGKR